MARQSRVGGPPGPGHRWIVVAVVALFVISPLSGATAVASTAVADAGSAPGSGASTDAAAASVAPSSDRTVRNETGVLPREGARDLYNVTPRDDVGRVVIVVASPPKTDFDLFATVDGRTPNRTDHDFKSYEKGPVEKLVIPGKFASRASEIGLAVRSYNGSGRYALRITQYAAGTGTKNRKPVAVMAYRCVATECVLKPAGRDVDGSVANYTVDATSAVGGSVHELAPTDGPVRATFSPGGFKGATHEVSTTVTDDGGAERSVATEVSVYPPYPPGKARAVPVPDKVDDKLEDGSDTLGSINPEGGHPLSNLQDGDTSNSMELHEEYIGEPDCGGWFTCLIDLVVNHLFGDGDYYYGMQVAVAHGLPAEDIKSNEDVKTVKFQLSYRMGNDPEQVDLTVYNADREPLVNATLDATTSRDEITFELNASQLTEKLIFVYSNKVEDEGENDETQVFVYNHHFFVVTGNTTSNPR